MTRQISKEQFDELKAANRTASEGEEYRIDKQADGWHVYHRSNAWPQWADIGTCAGYASAVRLMAWGMKEDADTPQDCWRGASAFLKANGERAS